MPDFTQWDLATYPGMSAAVVAAVGALKKLFPEWIRGKEAHLSVVLSYAVGIAVKLTVPGAFENVHWVVYLISLLVVAAGAKFGHDFLVNRIVKNKATEKEKA